MSNIIHNLLCKNNISADMHIKNNNILDIDDTSIFSKSIFYMLNKYLINHVREFDNISTNKKKEDKDSIYTNFAISNLLHMLIYQDDSVNLHAFNNINNHVEKKK